MATYDHDPRPVTSPWLTGLQRFLVFWGMNALALWVASEVLDSVSVDGPEALLLAALAFGIANTFLKPALLLLTLPIAVLTLGLFVPVLNALILFLVAWIVPGFHVGTFWQTVGAALFVSIFGIVVNLLIGGGRIVVRRH